MSASETPTNPPTRGEETPQQPSAIATAVAEVEVRDVDSVSPATPSVSESGNGSRTNLGRGYSSNRYADYDAHELLEKISQYEDERRRQRIREGIWISIIFHILFFSGLTWIPRYVFHQNQLIDPIDAIKQRKDLTYLDELPDALKQLQKVKPKVPVLKPNEAQVDKKTLDALKAMEKEQPKPKPAPEEQAKTAPPAPVTQPQPQAPAAPQSTAPPVPNPQIPIDAPRPSPVPARPSFSLGPQNPADQLHQAMRDAEHRQSGSTNGPSLAQHSGANGGAEILSDTQGVDFGPYMQKVIRETYRTWDPLIPEEVNPPILKRGQCEIIFTILPNGRIQVDSMKLAGRSGDVALDRAAWGSITGADYPPLPREFHGPYLQLRFRFLYNIR